MLTSLFTKSLHLQPGTPHAVLCTPDKRYILTQRNTSNSLILLLPDDGGERDGRPGLNIVGTMHETIEVAPEPVKPKE